jgi:hypothetical protein
VISFPSGSSHCGAKKVKRIIPWRYAMIKRLQVDLLASLEPFCFGFFGDFIPKGENVRPKQAKWFQSGKRQTTSEHMKKRSKKGGSLI